MFSDIVRYQILHERGESPEPLEASTFAFPIQGDAVRQPKRKPVRITDEDFPLAIVPAPVVPDLVWDVEQPVVNARIQTRPTPDAQQLLESLFEDPPAAPENVWDNDDQPVIKPTRPLRTEDGEPIEESLFGTFDVHPGFWFIDEVGPIHARRTLRPDEAAEVLETTLFVETPPTEIDEDYRIPFYRSAKAKNEAQRPVDPDVGPGPGLYTRIYADSLRFYLTGAGSDGGTQTAQTSSLGNYRSSTEAEHGSYLLIRNMPGITIDYASRANGDDSKQGSLIAVTSDTVAYAAPGGTLGSSVVLVNGSTYTVSDGNDGSKFVRVTRTSSNPLLGKSTIEYTDQYTNVVSMSDADNTETTSGGDRYRAIMLRGAASATVENIKLYLKTLGTQTVSAGGGLPNTGNGTISAVADGLCDWPHQGWCRIVDSGGTLREIVYYSARTNNQLTVPSLGRGLLGTSATLGAADDAIYPVPPIRIAYESAGVDAAIQTIADETTSPTGVTWSTAISAANGIAAGSLATSENGGLWIHRELPAGISAYSEHQTQINVQFDVEGETYTEPLGGLFRCAVTASRRLELHIGVGSLPDLDATPDETETVAPGTTPESHLTSSPWTTTATLTDDATNYIAVNFRNEYGLRSEELLTETITLASGVVVSNPPSAPTLDAVDPGLGGKVRIRGAYYYEADPEAARANQWLIYITSDGTDPDPTVDSPVTQSLTAAGNVAALDYTTTATYSDGATVKVLLRVRRTSDTVDSASSQILSTTAIATGPDSVSGGLYYRRQAEGGP